MNLIPYSILLFKYLLIVQQEKIDLYEEKFWKLTKIIETQAAKLQEQSDLIDFITTQSWLLE